MELKVGQLAPSFELTDQNGKTHNLSDIGGRWVLIYFYPKDDTPGCIKEACLIRGNFPKFGKLNIQVFGISADSVKSHKKFAQKYELPFTLLADEKKEVIKKYGVWAKKKFMGKEYMGILRTSFLINPEGIITRIYKDVKPDVHANEVLADMAGLTG